MQTFVIERTHRTRNIRATPGSELSGQIHKASWQTPAGAQGDTPKKDIPPEGGQPARITSSSAGLSCVDEDSRA